MKAAYIFLSIFFVLGCNPNTDKFDTPDKNLICELIIETIKQDTLDTSLSISNKLVNYYFYKVTINEDSDLEFSLPPPPPPTDEKGEPLILDYFRLNQKILIGYTISPEDSLYFDRQIKNSRNTELDSVMLKNIIRVEKIIQTQLDKNRSKKYYKFLIPLFNHDKSIAWVGYNYRCPGCGYGKMVTFRKINNNWLKIDSYITWRN